MKIIKTVPMYFVIFFAFQAQAFNVPSEYTTVRGTVYKLNLDVPPETQPAYLDPAQLTWGDMIEDNSGKPKLMNHFQSEATCNAIVGLNGNRARLPTLEEAKRLRNSMSADLSKEISDGYRSENPTYDRTKPALPNLTGYFWTSSIDPDFDGAAGVYGEGNTTYFKRGNYWAVRTRCVID